jgi:hypothetical protein
VPEDDISLAFAWGAILLVPSIAFVLIFALVWFLSERRTWFARRLKPVRGRLVEAYVSAGEIQRPGRRGGPSMYLPRGRYEYAVDGKTYAGTTVSLQIHGYRSEEDALAAFDGRRAGDDVTIWYDPAHPDQSSLTNLPPQGGRWYKRGLVIAAIAAVCGAFLMATN